MLLHSSKRLLTKTSVIFRIRIYIFFDPCIVAHVFIAYYSPFSEKTLATNDKELEEMTNQDMN